MNQFMFAFVAVVTIAANGVVAKPSAYGAPSVAVHAAPASYGGSSPVSVSYHAIPASAVVPSHSEPSGVYTAPSHRAPGSLLQPLAVQASHGGHAAAPAVPSPLIAIASQPVATSSANTQVVGLAPGQYSQIAIPSYEILSGNKITSVLESSNPNAGYAATIGAPTLTIIAAAPAVYQPSLVAAAPTLAYGVAAPAAAYGVAAPAAAYGVAAPAGYGVAAPALQAAY